MNDPLRDHDRNSKGDPCPLAVCTHFAMSGIKKLRKINMKTDFKTLWRGMRNLEVAQKFMEQGGTELAFMSTTTSVEVAVRYSLSSHSLLFKIIPCDFMATGAGVQWLSAFPGEEEILYPPLAYLKPTGRTEDLLVERQDGQNVLYSVVEVEPSLA